MTDTPDWSALPVPADDGAADHLPGMMLADIALPSTDGADVSLAAMPGRLVVFCYPMTAQPGADLPEGWSEIPGARGCTAQACAFSAAEQDLYAAGASGIYGVSTQSTVWQAEAKSRLSLPYPLLSDRQLHLSDSIGLPVFHAGDETLLRRLTMIVEGGRIEAVHYPVFPPDVDADWVLERLRGPSG